MPRLRNPEHNIDLEDSDLAANMKQRLHELNGSSVINLLNTRIIYYTPWIIYHAPRLTLSQKYSFDYEENVLYRYLDGVRECEIRHFFERSYPAGISWNFVTDIELEDDTLVFYQR